MSGIPYSMWMSYNSLKFYNNHYLEFHLCKEKSLLKSQWHIISILFFYTAFLIIAVIIYEVSIFFNNV